MLWEKIRKFWKAGLAETLKDTVMPSGNKEETNKILSLFILIGIVSLMIAGCGDKLPEASEVREIAFTNRIVVQPFDDGTFRYLSNTIEQKELEVPKGGREI